MKRVWAVVLAAGIFLPLLAAPVSCDSNNMGPTFLKLFANPECLQEAGIEL